MINGIINVYKESGYTSHDLVNRLRRILGQKKIGHTGTLDPAASGVLPICLGCGTKLCETFSDSDKEYLAELVLGVTTDTQDLTGTVLERKDPSCSEEDVRQAVLSFIGTYDQIPPMYSAVKVEGRKLYELARRGVEVERRARRVCISNIIIEEMKLPRVMIRVTCSKGTYIRTLCEDIGTRLGCGGCMGHLVRTRVGMFRIEDALTLGEIEERAENGSLTEAVAPVDSFFESAGAAGTVSQQTDLWLHNGNPLTKEELVLADNTGFTQQMRLYDSEGYFIGLYRWHEQKQQYMPEKMFVPDHILS